MDPMSGVNKFIVGSSRYANVKFVKVQSIPFKDTSKSSLALVPGLGGDWQTSLTVESK